jgi:hypothetical protein
LPWKNDDLILYHGCTDQSLQPANPFWIAVGVAAHGIDPFVGAISRMRGVVMAAYNFLIWLVWSLLGIPVHSCSGFHNLLRF